MFSLIFQSSLTSFTDTEEAESSSDEEEKEESSSDEELGARVQEALKEL